MWWMLAPLAITLGPAPQPADEKSLPATQAPADPPSAPPIDPLTLGADGPGRLTVPVTIGTAGPYRFTIDSGAERTVISRELATRLGLQPGHPVRLTAMSGTSNVGTVVIPALAVSRAGATQIEAPMLAATDIGAPGLLGIDSLHDHRVVIDFDTNQMTVFPSVKRRGRAIAEPGEIVVRARSLLGQLVVTDAFYRDQRVRVVLDTGSVVSMGNIALRRRVGRDAGDFRQIELTSVTGQSLSADYTQIGDVRIGAVRIENLPVAFAEVPPFARFGLSEQPALLLGMDVLRQFHRVEIDFANREVRFTLPRAQP